MAIPIATIAMSDYIQMKRTPGKGQPPKVSRQRIIQLYSTDVWQY